MPTSPRKFDGAVAGMVAVEGIQIMFRVLLTVASATLVFVLLRSALDLSTGTGTSRLEGEVPRWRLEAPHITSAGTQASFPYLGSLNEMYGNQRAR